MESVMSRSPYTMWRRQTGEYTRHLAASNHNGEHLQAARKTLLDIGKELQARDITTTPKKMDPAEIHTVLGEIVRGKVDSVSLVFDFLRWCGNPNLDHKEKLGWWQQALEYKRFKDACGVSDRWRRVSYNILRKIGLELQTRGIHTAPEDMRVEEIAVVRDIAENQKQKTLIVLSFLHWCGNRDALKVRKLSRWDPPEEKEWKWLDTATWWKLKEICLGGPPHLAMEFALGGIQGLRRKEWIGVRLKDIGVMHRGARTLRVHKGKGGKTAYVPILPWFWDHYDKYMAHRSQLVEKYGEDPEELLVRRYRGHLCGYSSANAIDNHVVQMERLLRERGTNIHLESHMLRRTIAQILLDSGWDLRDIKEFLRHEDTKTTEIYLRSGVNQAEEKGLAVLNYVAKKIGPEIATL